MRAANRLPRVSAPLLLLLPLLAAQSSQDPAGPPAGFSASLVVVADGSLAVGSESALLGSLRAGEAGWMVSIQDNGAWAFRVTDGTATLSYLPTAARQGLLDGAPHLIQVTADRGRSEARFHFDGRQVAVYEMAGFEAAFDAAPQEWDRTSVRERVFHRRCWTREETQRRARERGFHPPPPPELAAGDAFRAMAWNIWHGGREDGEEIGPRRVAECIRAARADLVCMQETYGSGALIADALGFELYLRSSNLSILSRFPIGETRRLHQPFRFGGARIRLGPDHELDAFVLWINSTPDYWEQMNAERPPDAEAMVAAERATRGAEIADILAELAPLIEDADGVPLLVAGDFNSGSHLDWTEAARSAHRGLVVGFPVSLAMAGAGFTDAYRAARPDPLADPGHTWSPRFPGAWQDRIDYLYFQGSLELRGAEHLDSHPVRWPSDHGAMVAQLGLPEE